jgi:hypothetical protein
VVEVIRFIPTVNKSYGNGFSLLAPSIAGKMPTEKKCW